METDSPDHSSQIAQCEQANHNSLHISLRSRAEEDIVNDAQRKRIMLNKYMKLANKEELNCSQYSISRLKGLRSLNVASCNRISDISLKYAFDLIELEQLSLSKCQQVSAVGIESIVMKCPSIRTLNLSDCHNISDEAIKMISTQLKRLTYLHIERCSHLTDLSLDAIALNCKKLKLLNVRGCRSMCPEPNLRLQNLDSIQQILVSKPGPYVRSSEKAPKPPPMPAF